MYEPSNMCSSDRNVGFVSSTVCEPFGLIEARAAGESMIGGLPESIRAGVDGLLYRYRDPDDLERQMRRILTEPGLFERLASQLRPVIDAQTTSHVLGEARSTILDNASSGDAG
jgi:glycosyltransferase involved in cell wall biosynthesis